MKVKIISGYSGPGGSTIAFIMLTNELNKRNIDATFYGPHEYHLKKCNSGVLTTKTINDINSEDIVLFHFLGLNQRPPAKKVLFVSHETYWSKISIFNFFDTAVFLHDKHKEYHTKYTGEYEIIPNLKPELKPKQKTELDLHAGIIGGIETRKQTHVSIQRALSDNCTKIYLFGNINDENYFKKEVQPLIEKEPIIVNAGYFENKQVMYDLIGRVYHSSIGEVACLVKDECYITNTKFFGNSQTENEVSKLNNDEIINLWIKAFEK